MRGLHGRVKHRHGAVELYYFVKYFFLVLFFFNRQTVCSWIQPTVKHRHFCDFTGSGIYDGRESRGLKGII